MNQLISTGRNMAARLFGSISCHFPAALLVALLVAVHFNSLTARAAGPPDSTNDSPKEVQVLPTPAAAVEGQMRGEFEHQAALILGFNELVQYHPDTLAQIIEAVQDRIKIIGVIADDQQRTKITSLLQAKKLKPNSILLYRWPAEAMWVGDYAPLFVAGDRATAITFNYDEPNRDLEAAFGLSFAATFRLPFDHCQLNLNGDNLISNGDGLVATTTKIIDKNSARGYDAARVGALLNEHFHFKRWLHLRPLSGEATGNVSTFLSFCAFNKAIVGSYRPEDDAENAKLLDENAAVVKVEPTKDGPVELIRIPMPSHKDGNWRTYTSVIYANGVVLVPQYPDSDAELDKVALKVFRDALPKWKVVGVDCSKLIAKRGRCTTSHARFPYSMSRNRQRWNDPCRPLSGAVTPNALPMLPAPADNAAMEAEPPKTEPSKRKRRWFQFSLRTLMVAVTLLAAACWGVSAWRSHVLWQHYELQNKLRNGRLYVSEMDPSHPFIFNWWNGPPIRQDELAEIRSAFPTAVVIERNGMILQGHASSPTIVPPRFKPPGGL